MRLRIDLTSETNLRASSIGRRLSKAVSEGSANHDFIGMALSEKETVITERTSNVVLYKEFVFSVKVLLGENVATVTSSPNEKKQG